LQFAVSCACDFLQTVSSAPYFDLQHKSLFALQIPPIQD
jgi:hypothetical protein